MFTPTKSMIAKIVGKWKCSGYEKENEVLSNTETFKLHFTENIVSCSPEGNDLWPGTCEYEPIGSNDGGYYFREDGCFFQVKNLSHESATIELNLKITEENNIVKYLFSLERDEQ
jgi:hypothetical protein